MPSFKFKYQTLLDHRRTIEDQRQRELAKQMRHRMILQDQIRQMQQTLSESKRQLGDALQGTVDVSAIGQFARYNGQTARRANAIVRELAQAERRIEDARQRLLAASRDRKAMELLHDRHREQWRMEQDRRETEQLDDLALQAFVRRAAVEVA